MTRESKPLRVSFVEPSGLLYGSELALLDILQSLDRDRFDVDVSLPRAAPFGELLSALEIPCHELLPPAGQKHSSVAKLLAYLRIALLWAWARPDVIYVNQGGILRPIAMIAAVLKLPIVCQIQTLEDAQWVSSLKRYHRSVFAFICNSRFTAAQGTFPSDRTCILYQGYKPKALRGVRRRTSLSRLGVIGRICEGKGHYLMLDAASRMRSSALSTIKIAFIGDPADEDERIRLAVELCNRGLDGDVELRGHRTDLQHELQRLDVQAIPSRAEPLGRVLFESAEANLPALVADSGGLGEVSRAFNVGLRFESGSTEDFVAQLQFIFDNYEAISRQFEVDAQRMLASLQMEPYIDCIMTILERAARKMPTALQWFGEGQSDLAGGPPVPHAPAVR